jgi:hypothetical protein
VDGQVSVAHRALHAEAFRSARAHHLGLGAASPLAFVQHFIQIFVG